jgi:hypothetical protein
LRYFDHGKSYFELTVFVAQIALVPV